MSMYMVAPAWNINCIQYTAAPQQNQTHNQTAAAVQVVGGEGDSWALDRQKLVSKESKLVTYATYLWRVILPGLSESESDLPPSPAEPGELPGRRRWLLFLLPSEGWPVRVM